MASSRMTILATAESGLAHIRANTRQLSPCVRLSSNREHTPAPTDLGLGREVLATQKFQHGER
jgi:hypothetical protein